MIAIKEIIEALDREYASIENSISRLVAMSETATERAADSQWVAQQWGLLMDERRAIAIARDALDKVQEARDARLAHLRGDEA